MKGGGRKTIIGLFDLEMVETSRSSNGNTTEITYHVTPAPDTAEVEGDRLAGFGFSLFDPDDPFTVDPDSLLGGFTEVDITEEDDGAYEVTISLDPSSTVTSVDYLPPPGNDDSIEFDIIGGSDFADRLVGTRNNEVLTAGEGDDYLKGYGGRRAEVDVLTGGGGADTFALGDLNSQGQSDFGNSYRGSGYALITDFNFDSTNPAGSDHIQLLRNNGDYEVRLEDLAYGLGGENDATIYYRGNLIAVVQDIFTQDVLNLDSGAFTFVLPSS